MAKGNRYEGDSSCGVLPVFKESGMTSHDVVGRIRRLYGTMRVGHTGTLDPMATGVLVILIGRAAKAAEYIEKGRKRYEAVLRLGITTDTEDIGGSVISEAPVPESVDTGEIKNAFTGRITQKPPMYSAIKIGGRKMVDLARKGIQVDIPEREITVYSLEMDHISGSDYRLSVECSGGTYIRTLCADIGRRLGCGGTMASLCRTENSGFTAEQCFTLSAIEEMDGEARTAILSDTESLFSHCPAVTPPDFFARLAKDGCAVSQRKIGCDFTQGTRVRLCDGAGFFSLGEVTTDEEGISVIKPVKKFRLED